MNEDAEVPTENSPFGRVEMSIENDANTPSRPKGIRGWLAQSRVKWGIAILVAIVLLTVILVTTLLLIDTSTKFLKLWPNEPNNGIYFTYGSGEDWQELTVQLDELFHDYHNMRYRNNVVECKDGIHMTGDKVCYFDIGSLKSECTRENNYGYDFGQPCIVLQFNRITDWVPEPYTARELEEYMNLYNHSFDELSTLVYRDFVYLDCQGVTSFDKENMGPIEYTPLHGFETKYFPYSGQQQYIPPIVGIRFLKPSTGVIITLTCKLWAKNVKHTDGVPNDEISFTLLVD